MHIIIGIRGGHLVALVGVKGPDHLREKVGVQSEAGVEVFMDYWSGPGVASRADDVIQVKGNRLSFQLTLSLSSTLSVVEWQKITSSLSASLLCLSTLTKCGPSSPLL